MDHDDDEPGHSSLSDQPFNSDASTESDRLNTLNKQPVVFEVVTEENMNSLLPKFERLIEKYINEPETAVEQVYDEMNMSIVGIREKKVVCGVCFYDEDKIINIRFFTGTTYETLRGSMSALIDQLKKHAVIELGIHTLVAVADANILQFMMDEGFCQENDILVCHLVNNPPYTSPPLGKDNWIEERHAYYVKKGGECLTGVIHRTKEAIIWFSKAIEIRETAKLLISRSDCYEEIGKVSKSLKDAKRCAQ